MARYRISYVTYPSSKAATEYSRNRATGGFYAGVIINFMIFGSVIWYFYGIVDLFGDFDFINYISSLVAIIVMSWLTLYCYVLRNEITRRECELIILRENAVKHGIKVSEVKDLTKQIEAKYNDSMKYDIKIFFERFIPGLIAGTGVIGCFKSIYMMCYSEAGFAGFIISLCAIAGCVWYYRKEYSSNIIKEKNVEPKQTVASQNQNNQSSGEVLFCRKCGAHIYSDSIFCSKCGIEIIR